MRRLGATATLTALAISMVWASAASGAPGALDPSFGSGGMTALTSPLFGVAVQANGSVVASGGSSGSVAARFTNGGQLDGSFGAGGQVAGQASTGRGVAIQGDGKIVMVGSGSGMVIERFNGNGTPDSGFGASGIVSLLGAQGGAANAVAITPDGKIVVAGSELGSDSVPRVAVARLNPNGSLDSSFGSGGTELLDFSTYSAAFGVAVQHDGKIVIVGSQRPGLQITNGFVARLTTSGSLDGSFGGPGGALTCAPGVCFYYHPAGGAYASLNAVMIQNDGKIVTAGVDVRGQNGTAEPTCSGDCPHAIAVRLLANGVLDSAFGSGGVAALPSGTQTNTGDPVGAYGVGIGGGGDIVAAGDYQNEIGGEVALWAFTASGSPEQGFGSGGTVITAVSGNNAHPRALAVAADGGLLVAGQNGTGGFIARYIGLGPPPPSGTAPSVTTGTASSITQSSATVAGQINPNGLATTYKVDYGPTSGYGSTTSVQSAGSGTATVSVSAGLTGLNPGTTYHYRFEATNSAGTAFGADGTFTTSTAATTISAPSVVTGGASSIGEVAATVSGLVNPGGLKTTYRFEYGHTTAYGAKTALLTLAAGSSSSAVSAKLSGLRAGTSYHYRLVATNSAGTTNGSDRALRTVPPLKSVVKGALGSYAVAGIIKSGLLLKVSCNQRCSIRGSLVVSKAVAEQLGLGKHQVTLAGGSATISKSGAASLQLVLSKIARGALAHPPRHPLTLSASLKVTSSPVGGGSRLSFTKSVALTA